jgi:hypothetical protein
MYYFKEKGMRETKLDGLGTLSKTFRGLSVEKKERVLDSARSLLKIQDGNFFAEQAGKSVSFGKNRAVI